MIDFPRITASARGGRAPCFYKEWNRDMKGIYILTNPSFRDYVKIGYSDDIERRLEELNRSECIPFAFRIYAVYEVEQRLSDKKIHEIIDTLNPDLRSVENYNGRVRIREFYAMSPEKAYTILSSIATISGQQDKLHLIVPSAEEEQDSEMAERIEAEGAKERAKNFSFSKCGIMPGEEIEFCYDPAIKAVVIDDRNVEYEGSRYSLTKLAKKLTGKSSSIAGPRYFKYKGEWLNTIRSRMCY